MRVADGADRIDLTASIRCGELNRVQPVQSLCSGKAEPYQRLCGDTIRSSCDPLSRHVRVD
jgi:hypothetical protein